MEESHSITALLTSVFSAYCCVTSGSHLRAVLVPIQSSLLRQLHLAAVCVSTFLAFFLLLIKAQSTHYVRDS